MDLNNFEWAKLKIREPGLNRFQQLFLQAWMAAISSESTLLNMNHFRERYPLKPEPLTEQV